MAQILHDSAMCCKILEEQPLPEHGSCMATVDEDMSECGLTLESQIKQHQGATNLGGSRLYLWTERYGCALHTVQDGSVEEEKITSRYLSHT